MLEKFNAENIAQKLTLNPKNQELIVEGLVCFYLILIFLISAVVSVVILDNFLSHHKVYEVIILIIKLFSGAAIVLRLANIVTKELFEWIGVIIKGCKGLDLIFI